MMQSLMRVARPWIVLLAVLLLSQAAAADRIVLVDGREFEGEILEETSSSVKIKARQGAIVTTLTFRRHEVASIVRSAVSEDFLEQRSSDDDEESGAEDADSSFKGEEVPYMLIPIHGGIGEECFAAGIEKALLRARRSKVDYIVFDLDTPGGYISEAFEMMEQIQEFREDMSERGRDIKIYAYITNAISAGIWIIFSCDEIFFERKAIAGGAVVYNMDQTTGAAEVDAKLNSIVAAEIATVAEELGHDRDLVRAMVIMEAELWAHTARNGQRELMASRPTSAGGAARIEQLDSPETVLTLTAAQAEELGVGQIVPGGHEALGEALDIEGWSVAGRVGENAMAQARRDFDKRVRKLANLIEDAQELAEEMNELNKVMIPQLIDRASSLDPGRSRYTVFRDSGNFTPESRQRWMYNHDRCIAAWNDVLKVLKKLDRMDKRYKSITGESFFVRSSGRILAANVEETIAALRRSRNQLRP